MVFQDCILDSKRMLRARAILQTPQSETPYLATLAPRWRGSQRLGSTDACQLPHRNNLIVHLIVATYFVNKKRSLVNYSYKQKGQPTPSHPRFPMAFENTVRISPAIQNPSLYLTAIYKLPTCPTKSSLHYPKPQLDSWQLALHPTCSHALPLEFVPLQASFPFQNMSFVLLNFEHFFPVSDRSLLHETAYLRGSKPIRTSSCPMWSPLLLVSSLSSLLFSAYRLSRCEVWHL